MSLRQLKFKPRLQPSNIATGVSNRGQVTYNKKEQNEKDVPEAKLPSARADICDEVLLNGETNAHSPVESCIVNKLPLNEETDYEDTQHKKSENPELENESHFSKIKDGYELKYTTHKLEGKLIEFVSCNVSHPCETTRLDDKTSQGEKEKNSSPPVDKPSKESSPSISEVFVLTKGDTSVPDKGFNQQNENLNLNSSGIDLSANFNGKKEEPSSNKKNASNVEDELKLLTKLHKFRPQLNKPTRINISHNSFSSKQTLDTKKDHTVNENYQSFAKDGIEDKEEGVNEEVGLDIISPRISAQRKRRKRLSTSVNKNNQSKYLQSHRNNAKVVEYNESSSDSIEPNDLVLNRNKSNIDSVTSVQMCNQKSPFKPKLDDRTKKTFSSSALGKFYSEAKQNFTKKFRNQIPDSSKLTMLDLIFYNPSSNPMPQLERKRLEEPCEFNCDSEDNEKDSNIDSSKSDMSESNDNSEVPVPQLKVSADGKIVIAQESLVIEQSLGEISTDIEFITDNNPPPKKKKRKAKDKHHQGWSHEDTLKFYKALNSLGSDFETMKSVFPGRSRGNLKSKFKKEEKVHGDLIDKVMSHHGEFNIEDVLDELEVEKRLADATTGKGIYLCKDIKDHQITDNKKRKRKASLLSAKEITGIIKSGNKNHADENDQDCDIEEDSTVLNDHKRFRVDYKRPTRHLTKLLQILKQKNWPNDEEIDSEISAAIISSNEDEKSEHFVISTNIEYDTMKYTQYITYNSNNLENPVEINETISHD